MSLAQSIVEIFSNIDMVSICLWITGFILFCIEFFQPMHNVAYILGVSLIGAAFCVRMVYGSAGEAFVFVSLTSVLLFAVHCVSLVTQRRDWLKVARMEKAGERSRKYGGLIDSIGIANTPIDLTGNATINDVNLVVYSFTPIMQGEKVKITKITQERIIVERVD